MKRVPAYIVLLVALLAVLTALPASAQKRTEIFKVPDVLVGLTVGSCGDFDILSDWTALIHMTLHFDKDGNLIRTQNQYRLIGQSRYYNSTDPDVSILGGPGEVQPYSLDVASNILSYSGNVWKIKLPGYGMIFHETGKTVIDLTTNTILRDTGQNQFNDQDFAALCEALTP